MPLLIRFPITIKTCMSQINYDHRMDTKFIVFLGINHILEYYSLYIKEVTMQNIVFDYLTSSYAFPHHFVLPHQHLI